MSRNRAFQLGLAVIVGGGVGERTNGAAAAPAAGTMIEYSASASSHLHVPEARSRRICGGWTPNVAAQGPAKDYNLRAIFVDRITINGPDGKPVGKGESPHLSGGARQGARRHECAARHRRAHGRSGRRPGRLKLPQRHYARDAATTTSPATAGG